MNRQNTLMLLLIACLSFAGCGTSKPRTLYLFTWSEFFSPRVIEAFEEAYQCNVHMSIYDSNESMYAKLKLGASGYDLIFPSSYYLQILANQHMIQPLDPERIPNLVNLDPRYFKTHTSPLMGIPFLVAFSGIAYRQDRIQQIEPSWGVFGNSRYAGRMTMLNDMRDALGAALKYLGYSINTRNADEISQAADQLIAWKKNLAKYESEQYKNGLASAEFLIVQGHSIDITQVQQENPEVRFVFPKEGAILSIDTIAMPVEAKNQDLAYAFINFMLDPKHAAENIAHVRALIPVTPAYDLLDPAISQDPILFPSQEDSAKMELIEDVNEDIILYYKAWDRVKAS